MYYIYRKAMKTCALILECNPLYLIFIKATLGSSVSNQGTYINKLCNELTVSIGCGQKMVILKSMLL